MTSMYEGFFTIQDQYGNLLDDSCIYIDIVKKKWNCDTYSSLLNTLCFYGDLKKAESVLNYLNEVKELAKLDLELSIVHTNEKYFTDNLEGIHFSTPIPKESYRATYQEYSKLQSDYKEVLFFIANEKGHFVSAYGVSDKLDFKCRWFSNRQRAEEVLKMLKRQYPDMNLRIVEKFDDEI
ncbi:hypothetical protein [Acetivibrio cellulolyticus]|uniref:hypothetical protein n=1 Tax=Acetivibrio cellulolyticus TaxID=35830 RepID=UPI0002481B19|nr:hypothetical protein [Acetivibrio cellulolyticus]